MKKRYPLILNILLFLWLVLAMTGCQIGGKVLVSAAWKEDGILTLLFVLMFAIFIFAEKIGKFILSAWLFLWLVSQFFSHWSFTIADFGIGHSKIEYFEGTIKIIDSTDIYVPDLYHVILHVLILAALSVMIVFCIKSKMKG